MSSPSYLVIGGGVVGSSITYHLAKRGADVTLVEARSIAAVASGASAGGVRQQGRDPREMPLAIAAIARWQNLEDELEADLHYHRNGHLQVYADEAGVEAGKISIAEQQALGLQIELVEGKALEELIPGLASNIIAGRYTANDGHANPTATTQGFASAAQRHGAKVLEGEAVVSLLTEGERVIGVETQSGKKLADHVILATGAWTKDLVSPLGVHLPLQPVGLQMVLTKPMPALLKQVVGAYGRPLSLKQLREGNYLIGGGFPGDINMVSGKGSTRAENVKESYGIASDVFPDVGKADIEQSWIGIEAFCVDEIPVIGHIPGFDGLTVAAGFSGHGFAISPMTGQLVSELVLDGSPSLSLDAFAADRFSEADLNKEIVPHAG